MGLSRTVTTLTVSFALLGGGVTVAAREGAPLRVPLKNPAVAEPARSTDPSPAAAPPCGPSSDAVLSLPDASAPGGRRAVWVHRPAGPDYADLPVVYLLHGYPADPAALAHGSLPGLLDREMCRTGRPFVLAVPDGRAGRLDTEWGDDARGRFAVETFVTRQAVALVEGGLRRAPTRRVIAGFSMGGYGAAALALRHPDEYGQVAAFGGYFRIDDPDHVFGADSGAHDPGRLLASAAGQRYFLVEGRDEHTALQRGSIRGEAERFAAELRSHQVSVAVLHPPGGHGNDAWYPELGALVDFLDAGWR